MTHAFLISAVLVAIAEFGDKTQMLSLVLASRYRASRVLLGVLIAVVFLQLIATVAGRAVGEVLPGDVLTWVTGLLFIAFGVWTLRSRVTDDVEEEARRGAGLGPVLGVAVAFFLAELGDKTQVLTLSIAADPGAASRTVAAFTPLSASEPTGLGAAAGVWLGSIAGMMIVNGLAIIVGSVFGSRLRPRLVSRISGVAFILFGLSVIAAWVAGGGA